MFTDIANEFQNITKFELLQYFIDYRDFLQDDYSSVYAYFSGNSETIDNEKLRKAVYYMVNRLKILGTSTILSRFKRHFRKNI